jgi:hypothetical protein
MDLDLNTLLREWGCWRDEVCARLIRGQDGAELVQLRVDLGVLQMWPDGRPDGLRYRGHPSAYEYFCHETRFGRDPRTEDWQELHRELQQHNYRRLAFSTLAEDALREKGSAQARSHVARVLRDIDRCLAILEVMQANEEQWDQVLGLLIPTLIFNRARLLARLRVAEGGFEEAIEAVEAGVTDLEQALVEIGFDEEQQAGNPALAYLRQMGQRLREQSGIALTLREQLDEAIEREDFERAARLRDELSRRGRKNPP